jgi:phosphatidate cytidylyltransferase
VVLDVWAGGGWFHLFVALLAVLIALEWTAIVHRGSPLQFALHAAAGIAGTMLPGETGLAPAIVAIAALTVVSAAVTRFEGTPFTLWSLAGVPYAGLSAFGLVLLRDGGEFGAWAVLWVMVIVWSADTLAYFAGRLIGGPKLAPRLSPKKTWAGMGGAMAGSAIASLVFTTLSGIGTATTLALLALAFAIVEQGGDLFKSGMKRHFDVKDSGRVIPGHGGIIDRVDGLVAVGLAAALVGLWRGGSNATAQGLLLW